MTTMFEMVGYRLLVLPDPVETTSKGGIVIVTDEKLEKAGQQKGVVVSIGPECWKTPEGHWGRWVEEGDRILFAKNSGRLIIDTDTGIEYMVLNDTDVLARLHEASE